MSSPLAPVLVNTFIRLYKCKSFNECNLNNLKFYLRYVDDILAAFENELDSLDCLDFLNKSYPNIKFTIQNQSNHSIAFLDTFVSGINNQYLTL